MADTEIELNIFRESLNLLVLKALTWGPKHGYAIAEWIEQSTNTVLMVDEGTLYPALHRLARKKLVDAEWGLSENNRRAKYYAITPAGRAVLRTQGATWNRFASNIASALATESPPKST
ncbi:MAG TPA: PadR family transcriptional regulator [Gemmatimonadaceae bacterium]|jgi:transcriptional regulator